MNKQNWLDLLAGFAAYWAFTTLIMAVVWFIAASSDWPANIVFALSITLCWAAFTAWALVVAFMDEEDDDE